MLAVLFIKYLNYNTIFFLLLGLVGSTLLAIFCWPILEFFFGPTLAHPKEQGTLLTNPFFISRFQTRRAKLPLIDSLGLFRDL